MKRTVLLVLLVVTTLWLFPGEGRAQMLFNFQPSCVDHPDWKELRVYYGNGVTVAREDARLSLATLTSFMKGGVLSPPNTCTSFALAYNPTVGLYVDLLEVAAQRWQLSPTEFWRALEKLGDVTGLEGPKGVEFADHIADALATRIANNNAFDQATIDQHVSFYKDDYNNCRSSLVVAHSQGNLYAHLAFDKSAKSPEVPDGIPAGALRIVSIATPDIAVPGNGPHSTSITDKIIDLVRSLIGALGHNTSWGPDFPSLFGRFDLWGHGFEGYLGAQPSGDQIKNQIKNSESLLPRRGCFRFSQPTYSAEASAGVAKITVQRIGGGEPVTMKTSNGTAITGVDYTSVSVPVVVSPPTVSEQVVDIPLINSPTSTSEKTVNLSLLDPTSGVVLGSATLTINGINCPDLSPNITVSNYGSGNEIYESKPVLSFNYTIPGASISATGSKGNVRLSSSAPGTANGAYANIKVNYQDFFIVTSPGKSGPGQAVATFTSSGSAAVSCREREPYTQAASLADVTYYDSTRLHSDHRYSHIGTHCQLYPDPSEWGAGDFSNPLSIPFIYGAKQHFEVDLISSAAAPLFWGGSASASTNIGYNVTVSDPAAKVTWCRAAP